MRGLFFFGFLIFKACAVISQPNNDMIKIRSISVYKDFQEKGYTTFSAVTHFDDLKRDNITLLIVENESKEKLEEIINRAEKKKHNQTKLGTKNMFSEIDFEGESNSHKVVISSVGTVYNIFGNIKEERATITDLTNMINYKVTNSDDLKWLTEFSERMKGIETK